MYDRIDPRWSVQLTSGGGGTCKYWPSYGLSGGWEYFIAYMALRAEFWESQQISKRHNSKMEPRSNFMYDFSPEVIPKFVIRTIPHWWKSCLSSKIDCRWIKTFCKVLLEYIKRSVVFVDKKVIKYLVPVVVRWNTYSFRGCTGGRYVSADKRPRRPSL